MRDEVAVAAPGADVVASTLWSFTAALVPYAGAAVFAAFGIGYRDSMWLRRPPTRLYWLRGWQPAAAPSALYRGVDRTPPDRLDPSAAGLPLSTTVA
jgi:hypothetical protein